MYTFKKRKKVDWRNNKPYQQSYNKRYYLKHRQEFLNRAKVRQEEKGAEIKQYLKKYVRRDDEFSIKKQMIRAARMRAKKQSVPFDLSPDDFTIPDVCPVLGIKIQKQKGRFTANSPSLDKFIPVLGYIKTNVNVISHRANMLKWDASVKEIEALACYMRRITQEQG